MAAGDVHHRQDVDARPAHARHDHRGAAGELTVEMDQVARAKPWRRAALDLLLSGGAASGLVLAFPSLAPRLSSLSTGERVLALAVAQFVAAGAVPLGLVLLRGEPFGAYGLRSARAGASLAVGMGLAAVYLAALSGASGSPQVIPFARHGVLRLAAGLGGPPGALAAALVVGVWGIAEGFFAVHFCANASAVASALRLRGPLLMGALAFGAFNGALHVSVGQGWPGFWTSALSGIFVGLAPALTGNAWGGVLVQILTNAAGPVARG